MSASDLDENWNDWLPELVDPNVLRFKWGWNPDDGEEVWKVSGPGDGLPSHAEQLKAAWGREPNIAGGDVLGTASHDPFAATETDVIVIDVYYGARVPMSVVGWFEEAYPHALIRPSLDERAR